MIPQEENRNFFYPDSHVRQWKEYLEAMFMAKI